MQRSRLRDQTGPEDSSVHRLRPTGSDMISSFGRRMASRPGRMCPFRSRSPRGFSGFAASGINARTEGRSQTIVESLDRSHLPGVAHPFQPSSAGAVHSRQAASATRKGTPALAIFSLPIRRKETTCMVSIRDRIGPSSLGS